ncbi:MAG: DUF6152 family protein [Steroidobacteraceae bacterium]
MPWLMPRLMLWGSLLSTPYLAVAHHSAAPHYDMEKQISIAGVVSKFEFVNPHAYVYFIALLDGQQQSWRCELSARAFLDRMGWTANTFTVGQKVTFKGAPARREEHVCMLNSFVRADGMEVDARANLLAGGVRQAAPLPLATKVETKSDSAAATKAPSLSGYWVAQNQGGPGGGPGGGMGPGGPGGPGMGPGMGLEIRMGSGGMASFSAGGGGRPEASAAGVQAAKTYDQRFDDPAIKCSAGNIIFGWTHDQNVNEIIQTDKSITLKYGYMDLMRTIHLDATEHPKNLTPSLTGHSIGHWQGKELVVDTIGFKPGVLIPIGGLLHSEQLHIVERFSVDSAGTTLTRAYQVEDPLYLKASYSGSDVLLRSSEPYTPYNCVELSGKNNQRS